MYYHLEVLIYSSGPLPNTYLFSGLLPRDLGRLQISNPFVFSRPSPYVLIEKVSDDSRVETTSDSWPVT